MIRSTYAKRCHGFQSHNVLGRVSNVSILCSDSLEFKLYKICYHLNLVGVNLSGMTGLAGVSILLVKRE